MVCSSHSIRIHLYAKLLKSYTNVFAFVTVAMSENIAAEAKVVGQATLSITTHFGASVTVLYNLII